MNTESFEGATGGWQVVVIHDQSTPADFTLAVLRDFLMLDGKEAADIVQELKRDGRALCGLYPRTTADFIAEQVSAYARKHGHTLRCEVSVPKKGR
jgi:ATP-dependent Clp protease adaptor protein ClpS